MTIFPFLTGGRIMNKIISLFLWIVIIAGPFGSVAFSQNLELVIKDLKCSDDGKIAVHYSLINPDDFDHLNVTLGFKINKDGKPIACKELQTIIPKGSDDSDVKELIIDAPCSDDIELTVDAQLFISVKRYLIEEWFSDCN
jgi:hypothetical protein